MNKKFGVTWLLLIVALILIFSWQTNNIVTAEAKPDGNQTSAMLVLAASIDLVTEGTLVPRQYLAIVSNPAATPSPTMTPTPSPTISPTPVISPDEIACIYGLNWWRNPNPPFDIIRSSYTPTCLNATNVAVTNIFDATGRQIAYEAQVSRASGEDFEMLATYTFNSGGGVTGASVTKRYVSGAEFQLTISQFCPVVGPMTGFEVHYASMSFTHGTCG
ncbi:MAG: hypothetical protein KDE34_04980 [Anaerolineales bacterium]|nr:hypothetical protein [Anaerolineales bacterium]MCB8962527.1 hypothetical protein [Ardenticatenales bacterium]